MAQTEVMILVADRTHTGYEGLIECLSAIDIDLKAVLDGWDGWELC